MKRVARLLVLGAAVMVVIAAAAWRGKREPIKAAPETSTVMDAGPQRETRDGARHSRALMYLLR